MDVSPKEVVSIGTAMIPFLENDDANRALMGANMQRQAVPLLACSRHLSLVQVWNIQRLLTLAFAYWPRRLVRSFVAGVMKSTFFAIAMVVLIHTSSNKFLRSNQSTCFNQKPIVNRGDHVVKGQVLADGPATDGGELASRL